MKYRTERPRILYEVFLVYHTIAMGSQNYIQFKGKSCGNICPPFPNFVNNRLTFRRSLPKVLLGKCVLKICNKFTGEHPCRSAISIKLRGNFIEIKLWHRCYSVTVPDIFGTPFPKNTSEGLLLDCVFINRNNDQIFARFFCFIFFISDIQAPHWNFF